MWSINKEFSPKQRNELADDQGMNGYFSCAFKIVEYYSIVWDCISISNNYLKRIQVIL